MKASYSSKSRLLLVTSEPLRRTVFNHVFALIYGFGLVALFYHHFLNLFGAAATTTTRSTTAEIMLLLLMVVADIVLALQWAMVQLGFRTRPIRRKEHFENLTKAISSSSSSISFSSSSSISSSPSSNIIISSSNNNNNNIPDLDIFICTADPYKEPPLGVVNTALSVMSYEYYYCSSNNYHKLSVYVSDDGASQLTLFAFIEAAGFARHWLPFCRNNNIQLRSPEAYFHNNNTTNYCAGYEEIKSMYERMKIRVESVVDQGHVGLDNYYSEKHLNILSKWTETNFTRQDHPPVIQVLIDNEYKDISGCLMPKLIYVSRGKSKTQPHNFKAGALNALVRVSASMTNAPIILTLDCDMYSNDPWTLLRALCYFLDPVIRTELGYLQFPQIFHGLNSHDIYASEHKRLFQINPLGFDGHRGPNYVGSNCFFQRRALFGGPYSYVEPEIPELSPTYVVNNNNNTNKPIGSSKDILELANRVAAADYETHSSRWGSEVGFKYGSLVEDFYTGYRLQCEGWRAYFCHPERPAFLGDAPITLIDLLGQSKRWSIGLLEVLFCRYSTITYGVKKMGLCMGLGYSHYSSWPIWSIPVTIYAFVPQLALLNGLPLFPEVLNGWSLLYLLLFMGSYGQDLVEFVLAKGSILQWWNAQRMWMITSLSSFLFGFIEYSLKHMLGGTITLVLVAADQQGFNVTSKVQEDELISKRYKQCTYEFGVESPMFVPITMAAIMNLVSLLALILLFGNWNLNAKMLLFKKFGLQLLLCGFVVVNSWPVYQAMFLRKDKGRLPYKIIRHSALLVSALCLASALIL